MNGFDFDKQLAAETARHYEEFDRQTCCVECADRPLDEDGGCDCDCHAKEATRPYQLTGFSPFD